jgi:hypothetical protein
MAWCFAKNASGPSETSGMLKIPKTLCGQPILNAYEYGITRVTDSKLGELAMSHLVPLSEFNLSSVTRYSKTRLATRITSISSMPVGYLSVTPDDPLEKRRAPCMIAFLHPFRIVNNPESPPWNVTR